jgi:hypothetical protein
VLVTSRELDSVVLFKVFNVVIIVSKKDCAVVAVEPDELAVVDFFSVVLNFGEVDGSVDLDVLLCEVEVTQLTEVVFEEFGFSVVVLKVETVEVCLVSVVVGCLVVVEEAVVKAHGTVVSLLELE